MAELWNCFRILAGPSQTDMLLSMRDSVRGDAKKVFFKIKEELGSERPDWLKGVTLPCEVGAIVIGSRRIHATAKNWKIEGTLFFNGQVIGPFAAEYNPLKRTGTMDLPEMSRKQMVETAEHKAITTGDLGKRIINLPDDRTLRAQLGMKLGEYRRREGGSYEYRFRIEFLKRLLRFEQVDIAELERDMKSAWGRHFHRQDFESDCGVIIDYVETRGMRLRGGTGLPELMV